MHVIQKQRWHGMLERNALMLLKLCFSSFIINEDNQRITSNNGKGKQAIRSTFKLKVIMSFIYIQDSFLLGISWGKWIEVQRFRKE